MEDFHQSSRGGSSGNENEILLSLLPATVIPRSFIAHWSFLFCVGMWLLSGVLRRWKKNMQLKTKTVGMTPKESYNEAREASAVKFPVPVRFPSSVFIVATTITNQHVMPKRPPKGRRRYEKSNSLHLISLEAYLLPLHRSSAAQTRVNGSTFRKQREIIS